jgi:pimeloyl-ACP methyl ester carboxylesterase
MAKHIEENWMTATADDGTSVRAQEEGQGRVILILHPGMDTGKSYARVAARLAQHFRVIRLHRRQYRLDLKADPIHGSPCSVADEVKHVLALVKTLDAPALVFGHSSGGPVALEACLAAPGAFAGAMIYEPAAVVPDANGLYLSLERLAQDGAPGDGLKRARAALAAGRPGLAIGIFTQLVVGWPSALANAAGELTALFPAYRQLIPCQIDDLEAMERLGLRLAAYRALDLPVALVGGEQSPASLQGMVAGVAGAVPGSERITLKGQGHACNTRDPEQLAAVIAAFAHRVYASQT